MRNQNPESARGTYKIIELLPSRPNTPYINLISETASTGTEAAEIDTSEIRRNVCIGNTIIEGIGIGVRERIVVEDSGCKSY